MGGLQVWSRRYSLVVKIRRMMLAAQTLHDFGSAVEEGGMGGGRGEGYQAPRPNTPRRWSFLVRPVFAPHMNGTGQHRRMRFVRASWPPCERTAAL